MVRFECDRCHKVTTHNVFGMDFAYRWLKSNRAEVARCSEFGAKTECDGILRSGLSDAQIDNEMETMGYGKYIQRFFCTTSSSSELPDETAEPPDAERADEAAEPPDKAADRGL